MLDTLIRRRQTTAVMMPAAADRYARALAACQRGQWSQALELATGLLMQSPQHADAHYIAGIASLELRRMPSALQHLNRATELDPSRVQFAVARARTLSMAQMPAVDAANAALMLAPTEPAQLLALGMVYAQEGDHQAALPLLRRACAARPQQAAWHYFLAMSLTFMGKVDEADSALDTCLGADPGFWRAYFVRSQLRRQTVTTNHLGQLTRALTGIDRAGEAATCLHMALAKEHEDLAHYPEAFAHYSQGKASAKIGRHYAIERDAALFAAITSEFPQPPAATGCTSNEPIFVVGMPRSGTTLVERILACHPQVCAAGELRNFALACKRFSGNSSPQLLDPETVRAMGHADWAALGASYLASTRPRTGHTAYFVDKLPHNFLYLGAIARALPNAKLVCLRRDPRDTCLGNFRQLFASNSPFHDYSYDLKDIGRYYVLFDRLMAHWRRTMPGRIFELDYESMVNSQESSTRDLLQFCDLPWDNTCLHFEGDPSAATSASSLQVREPMHRGALGRWRRFEADLEPLLAVLREAKLIPGD